MSKLNNFLCSQFDRIKVSKEIYLMNKFDNFKYKTKFNDNKMNSVPNKRSRNKIQLKKLNLLKLNSNILNSVKSSQKTEFKINNYFLNIKPFTPVKYHAYTQTKESSNLFHTNNLKKRKIQINLHKSSLKLKNKNILLTSNNNKNQIKNKENEINNNNKNKILYETIKNIKSMNNIFNDISLKFENETKKFSKRYIELTNRKIYENYDEDKERFNRLLFNYHIKPKKKQRVLDNFIKNLIEVKFDNI